MTDPKCICPDDLTICLDACPVHGSPEQRDANRERGADIPLPPVASDERARADEQEPRFTVEDAGHGRTVIRRDDTFFAGLMGVGTYTTSDRAQQICDGLNMLHQVRAGTAGNAAAPGRFSKPALPIKDDDPVVAALAQAMRDTPNLMCGDAWPNLARRVIEKLQDAGFGMGEAAELHLAQAWLSLRALTTNEAFIAAVKQGLSAGRFGDDELRAMQENVPFRGMFVDRLHALDEARALARSLDAEVEKVRQFLRFESGRWHGDTGEMSATALVDTLIGFARSLLDENETLRKRNDQQCRTIRGYLADESNRQAGRDPDTIAACMAEIREVTGEGAPGGRTKVEILRRLEALTPVSGLPVSDEPTAAVVAEIFGSEVEPGAIGFATERHDRGWPADRFNRMPGCAKAEPAYHVRGGCVFLGEAHMACAENEATAKVIAEALESMPPAFVTTQK